MSKRKPRRTGMRTAHLKRFSSTVVNAGKQANSLVVQEYASRAKTLRTPPAKANYSDNEEHYNKQRNLALEPADIIISPSMKELWQQDFWQGYTEFHRINLILNPERGNLFLFVSGNRFFFIKETPNRSLRWEIERSLIYPNREVAMRHYRSATICWIKRKDVGNSILEKRLAPKLHLERIKVI